MNKKYLPLLVLIAAALLLFNIKRKQRGKQTTDVTIPAVTGSTDDFDRGIGQIVYSKHAKCRMECRHIDTSEVREILQIGKVNHNKIEEDDRGKTYPLEGMTHDKQNVRIVFAPHKDELVVVTVIDLDTEWPCDCK